jgi:hypothetical protein
VSNTKEKRKIKVKKNNPTITEKETGRKEKGYVPCSHMPGESLT